MAIELRRSSKEQNLPAMSLHELQTELPEPSLLAIQLNDFLASVDKIRSHIAAISWTTNNDLIQVMTNVINNPRKLTKAEIFKRLGISVQKGIKLVWTVYNGLTNLHKDIMDMDSSLHLQENHDRRATCLFLKKIKKCHYSTLCHLLHENMLELVKQEQVCRQGVIAFFASKRQKPSAADHSKQCKFERYLQRLHSQESPEKSSEQEALEEAVVSLQYAVSQVNELMERKDDLSDCIEYIVVTATEEIPEPSNKLHAQFQPTTSYAKKRDAGCQIM